MFPLISWESRFQLRSVWQLGHFRRERSKLGAGLAQSLDFVLALSAASDVPRDTPALPASQIAAGKQRDLCFRRVLQEQTLHEGFLAVGRRLRSM